MIVEAERAPFVVWRALAATVLVMTGAVLAHTWSGGRAPTVPGLVALAAVVFAAGMLVLRGSLRGRALLPLVAVAQLGLHESFGLLGPGGHAEHVQAAGTAGPSWTWQMLLAHTSVTLFTALVWRLCERAAVVVTSLLHLRPTDLPGPGAPGPTGPAPGCRPSALLHLAPVRGPPSALGRA